MTRLARLARLAAAAFLMDLALYLTLTGAPYKALALGAGPLVLGLIPMARALPYSLITTWAGHRSEGTDRMRIARWTVVVGGMSVLALAAAPGFGTIFALLAVVGVAVAFFWPALQATFAELPHRAGVAGNLSWFNFGWSTGKGMGFLLGGFLLARFGFTAVFATAAVAMVATLPLLLGASRGTHAARRSETAGPLPGELAAGISGARSGTPGESFATTGEPAIHPRLGRFRRAGWLGNAVAFGVAGVLNHHYPNWLEAAGRPETLFGSYLGLIFFAQTASFFVLTRWRGWRYRVWPLLAAPVPMAATLALLPGLENPVWILATAPAVGMALGFAYSSSIFYSVAAAGNRGRNAGVHEAALGFGSILLPLMGGLVARVSGNLAAPYWTAAGVALAAAAVQTAWLVSGDRASPETTGTPPPRTGY